MNAPKPYLYLAGPLFSEAERSFNAYIKQALSAYFGVYLPQEDGALMPDLLKAGHIFDHAKNIVFKNDLNAIKQCDAFFVILDGRSIDEGAAFELGFAYSIGKPCVGFRTDFRRLSSFGNNPMIDCALDSTFTALHEVIRWAKDYKFCHCQPECGHSF